MGRGRSATAIDRKLRDLRAALDELDGRDTHETIAAGIADALGVTKVVSLEYAERAGRVRVAAGAEAGLPGIIDALDEFLTDQPPVGWTGYNPLKPDPFDRNLLRTRDEIEPRCGTIPIVRDVFPRFGVARAKHVRVVVCEGPSMLGYLGLFQEDDFAPRQLEALRRLVPDLRKRLLLERTLSGAAKSRSVLLAALEAIAAPAWVVDASGAIEHANRAAEGALVRDREGTLARLHAVAKGQQVRGLDATTVRGRGERDACLVIERLSSHARGAETRVEARAAKMGLSPRQTVVYRLVARGLSNQTIAAELSISQATVEQHVSALLDRAGVESRAALIAQLLWSDDGDATSSSARA